MASLTPQVRVSRIAQEIRLLSAGQAYGITCAPEKEDEHDVLDVTMRGPKDTPYSSGVFKLTVTPTDKYPFEPPLVKFVTPVYHPNIDKGGRICLDMLKMPPKGSWAPTITLETLLVSIQTLLGTPNPEDPLMMDIANEYKNDIDTFNEKAKKNTEIHACGFLKPLKRKTEDTKAEEQPSSSTSDEKCSQDKNQDQDDVDKSLERKAEVDSSVIRNVPLFSSLSRRPLSRKRNKE